MVTLNTMHFFVNAIVLFLIIAGILLVKFRNCEVCVSFLSENALSIINYSVYLYSLPSRSLWEHLIVLSRKKILFPLNF